MESMSRRQGSLQVVAQETSVEEILNIMRRENVGIVLVLEGRVVIGTVSDRDIAMKGLLAGKPADRVTAQDVMTPHLDGCIGKAMRRSELHILE